MFDLRAIAWKLCKAAKMHVFTSISIIAVAICLIVTMATYIHNAKSSLDANIELLYGKMDVLAGFDYGQGQFVSYELYEQISEMPEVDAISPVSLEMTNIENLTNIYTLGVENDELVKSRYRFNQDLTEETVIISELLAKTLAVKVGNKIELNERTYTVIEVLPTPIEAEPVQMAILHNDELKQDGFVSLFMLIQTEAKKELAEDLYGLDAQLRIDIVDDYDFIKMNVQTLLIFVVILSVFILLITALLLSSNIQLLFTKIKGQLVILRSLGASSIQIVQLVKVQLVTIICLGLITGTIMSILVIQFALPKIIMWMNLPKATTELPILIILIIIAAMGVLLTAYISAKIRSITNILPFQVVNDTVHREIVLKKWNLIIIGICIMGALLLVLGGLANQNDQGALQILFGSLFFILIILYLVPFLFQWLLKIIRAPIRVFLGKEAYLACQHLIPQIRMNIKIVLALIGLIVILVFGSSLLNSLQMNEQKYIQERFKGEYILSNTATNMMVGAKILTELQTLPDTDVKSATSRGSLISMTPEGESFDLFAENLMTYEIKGPTENKIVITEAFAKKENIELGDHIAPYFLNFNSDIMQQQPNFEVVKILNTKESYIGAYIDWTSMYAINNLSVREIKFDTGNRTHLEELLSRYPMFQLLEKQQAIEQANVMFYQRWSLFIGIFSVLMVATTIGIIQTLWHLIYTSRSQYTIQRLLGLSPSGLIKYLYVQVLTFVLYGLGTGLFLGIILTRLVMLIDQEGEIKLDFMTIGLASAGLFLFLIIIFSIQGYVMSRKKLSDEILKL